MAQYPVTFGGAAPEFVSALAVDQAGNTYVGGHFTGTVDFDPGAGTTELTASPANGTGFLASFTPTGALRWAMNLGGETHSSTGASMGGANDIEIGPNGQVYVTGTYGCNACDFDPGASTVTLPDGTGGVFVASYTRDGQFRYVLPLDNPSRPDLAGGLVVDGAGTVVVTGGFRGEIDFDPGAGVAAMGDAGGTTLQVFVASYDTDGEYISAFMLDGTAAADAQDIGRDAAGNITIVGGFVGTLDLDPGAGTADVMPGGNNEDTFVASYTAAGAYRWGHTVGGDTNRGFGADVEVDDAGNVYVAGSLWGSADIDPGSGTTTVTSSGLTDILLVAYDNTGAFRHGMRAGGSGPDAAQDVALDSNGNVVITGTFFNTIDLDPSTGTTSVASNGISDMVLASYDPSGQFLYGLSVGGSSLDGGAVVAGGPYNGVVAVGGYFGETVDFDPDATNAAERASAGESDGFVALYDMSGIAFTRNEAGVSEEASALALSAHPNPAWNTASLRLTLSAPRPVRIAVYDALGHQITVLNDGPLGVGTHTLAMDVNGLAPGIYVVRAVSEDAVVTQRLTVVR